MKTCSILPAKHGTCRWVHGNDISREAILDGAAADLLVRLAGQEQQTTYTVEPVVGLEGLVGWTLTKWDADGCAVYHLPADVSSCSCPDHRSRVRLCGCKHRVALLAALRKIGLVS
jgi:hypothetical protein